MRLSARKIGSKSTSPCPGETKSQPRPGSPKFEVAAEDRRPPVERALRVLDVDVEDPVRELVDERRRLEELMLEVARVEVDPEARRSPIASSALRGRHEVVGDLGRVHLEREAHALGLEDVDDRPPALGELLVAALDLAEVVGRERVEEVPDRRAGEARDDLDAELRSGPRGVHHPLGGPLRARLGLAVAPDLGREHALVARGDRVAHGLADEVVADRPDAAGRGGRAARAAPSRSRGPRPPARRRSDRPSTRARGRRSPTRRTSPPAPSSGKSAHWPVKSVTGLAMSFLLLRSTPMLARRRARATAHPGSGCRADRTRA